MNVDCIENVSGASSQPFRRIGFRLKPILAMKRFLRWTWYKVHIVVIDECFGVRPNIVVAQISVSVTVICPLITVNHVSKLRVITNSMRRFLTLPLTPALARLNFFHVSLCKFFFLFCFSCLVFEHYQPHSFFLKCVNCGRGSGFVIMSASCSKVGTCTTLIFGSSPFNSFTV